MELILIITTFEITYSDGTGVRKFEPMGKSLNRAKKFRSQYLRFQEFDAQIWKVETLYEKGVCTKILKTLIN